MFTMTQGNDMSQMLLIVMLVLGLSSMMKMQTHAMSRPMGWGGVRGVVRGSIGWQVQVQNTAERLKVTQELKQDLQRAYALGADPKEIQDIVEYYALEHGNEGGWFDGWEWPDIHWKDIPAFIEEVIKVLSAVEALAKLVWPWIQTGATYIAGPAAAVAVV